MRRAALVSLAAALAAAAPASTAPIRLSRTLSDRAAGISVRSAAGWTIRRSSRAAVFDPVLRSAIPSPSGARLELQERQQPALRDVARRPAVRFRRHAELRRVVALGRSVEGRPIRALELGDPAADTKILVVGCIHGTECAGVAVVDDLARADPPAGVDLWLVPNLNPDGLRRRTRQNAHGVDLNRNFPSEWRAGGAPGDYEYPGPRPASEPETRIAMRLIRGIRPRITLWFHQPENLVRAWGGSIPEARRYARLAGLRFAALPWPRGTAPNWQNHAFPGAASFVVELPPGRLASATAARLARAALRLSQ